MFIPKCCFCLSRSTAILFSLFDLLLPLLLPLPLSFLSVSLHHLLIVVGEHWIILVCQWDKHISRGETTRHSILVNTQLHTEMKLESLNNCVITKFVALHYTINITFFCSNKRKHLY